MNKTQKTNRSVFSWLSEFAKGRRGEYLLSVITALIGVACSLIPYFIIIKIITALINGTAELSYYLTLCVWMAGLWILRYILHSVSTTLSHHATFHVLAKVRIMLLDKLATLPLGTVLDRSSGSYKNIIVERVDSIETTLAHLLPEMTANIVGALAVLALIFANDWRMGLSMLIVLPLGTLCFMSMFRGYNEKFQRTVTSTKALNDTAVEYIGGIEVIKAFGQSKPVMQSSCPPQRRRRLLHRLDEKQPVRTVRRNGDFSLDSARSSACRMPAIYAGYAYSRYLPDCYRAVIRRNAAAYDRFLLYR